MGVKKKVQEVAAPMLGIETPLEFDVDGAEVLRASEIVIQANGHETTFNFFVVDTPLIWGTPEQQMQQARKIKSVKARCVARVVIPTSKMAQFAEAVRQNQQQQHQPMRMIGHR